MAAPAVVQVVGLAALRRDLNRMGSEANGPLYQVLTQAARRAAEPVATRARGAIPKDSGALSGDVRISTTKTGATVRMGRKSIPYAGWVEFGGTRPDGSEREYLPNGRYLFPAARSLSADAARTYSQGLEQVLASDRVWTNTSVNVGSVHD